MTGHRIRLPSGTKTTGGKVKMPPPRMAPVLATAKKIKADRLEKQWAAKGKKP